MFSDLAQICCIGSGRYSSPPGPIFSRRESSEEIAHLGRTATEFCTLVADLRQIEMSGHANGLVSGHSRSSGEKWCRNIFFTGAASPLLSKERASNIVKWGVHHQTSIGRVHRPEAEEFATANSLTLREVWYTDRSEASFLWSDTSRGVT
jgi:hypothetical protein